jgi:putative addiction module component (TIGR02574 family)
MAVRKAAKPTFASVLKDAMSLPRDEREDLAYRLFGSFEKDPDYDEAWAAELARRWKSIQDGTTPLLDDDAFDAIAFGPLDDDEE